MLKKGALRVAFVLAASAAFTISTGFFGIHEPMVALGGFFGDAVGLPVFAENFEENVATLFETGEFNFWVIPS